MQKAIYPIHKLGLILMHFTNKFLTHLQIFLALKMSDFSQKKGRIILQNYSPSSLENYFPWETNLRLLFYFLPVYYYNYHLGPGEGQGESPSWKSFFLCLFECCLDGLTCFKHKCNAFSCQGCIFHWSVEHSGEQEQREEDPSSWLTG